MHPWLKWLIWINPLQYAFEAIMSNEFYDLNLQCVSPSIFPDGPSAQPGNQVCAIQGSTPNQLVVQGSNYIQTAFTYTRSHLWRNFGIVIAWFILFVCLTMVGMELQKPNKGGSTVTIFKKGEAPEAVQEAVKNKELPGDVETGSDGTGTTNGFQEKDTDGSSDEVHGIARSTSIFTWQGVNYTIPYKDGHRKLLQDVQGYVKPGRLTALMGASGAGLVTAL